MQSIDKAMKILQESRVNRKLNKGDQFKNANGVVITIIDVDDEHLLDGEPQVTYRFEDGSKTVKCYKQSSVNAMLDQNNYKAMINEDKDRNYGFINISGEELYSSISNSQLLDRLQKSVKYLNDYADVVVENPEEYQGEYPNKLGDIANKLQNVVKELEDYWSNI